MKHIYIALLLILFTIPVFSQLEYIGPEGGYIQCMVTDIQENILAGTRFGGIYKTTDFGENWNQIFTGHRDLDVRSLAVNSSNVYFAGTDAGGFFRSTTDGVSWEKVNNILSSVTIQALLVTPNDTIYAGTFSGLFKSTDNGSTFLPASNGITTSSISSLAYSGSYLLAGTYYEGVFRSTDNAATWQALNTGLDFNGRTVTSIQISGASQTPYTSLGDKFYYYDEAMGSWEGYTDPPKGINNFIITDVRGVSSILAAGNTNITTQGGGVISHPVANPNDIWTIEIAPQKSCGSIVETTQGILVGYYGIGAAGSIDGLNTFLLKNNHFWATNITAMSNDADVVMVGTESGEVWLSLNNGQTWLDYTFDLPPGRIESVVRDPDDGVIYAATQNGVYQLYNTSWIKLSQPYAGESIGINSQGTIAIGIGSNMYVSQDNGQNWTSIYTGAPGVKNIVFDFNDKAYISATDEFNFQSLGVLTANPPLYNNWVQLGTGLENKIVTTVGVVDNGTFTSDCTGDIYAGTKDGKLFIFNNGQFTEHSDGITSTNPVTSIVSANITGNEFPIIEFAQERLSSYNPVDCNSEQVLTEDDIAFYKMIQARLLFDSPVNSQMNSENIYIYYGTRGTGVLRKALLSDVEIISSDIPANYSLEQNYPNPFNPSTKIIWQSPVSSHQTLKVYDLLGREIATLVNEEKPAGKYEVNFNANYLSSGIYFYELRAGEFVDTKKMILLR